MDPITRADPELATARWRIERYGRDVTADERRLVDVAVSDPQRPTLVLRFADVGVATYASLRVVGQPSRTVTWVVEEPTLVAALERLTGALPDPRRPRPGATRVERAITKGLRVARTELEIARTLGSQLIAARAWQLLTDCVASPRAALFVSPSARLARVPWGLPRDAGRRRLPADRAGRRPDGGAAEHRPLTAHTRRLGRSANGPPLLVLDPRVPGQRPDSPLGLGARHARRQIRRWPGTSAS